MPLSTILATALSTRVPPAPLVVASALTLFFGASGCASIIDNAVVDAISAPAAAAEALAWAEPMAGDPHAVMTRPSAPRPGDRERADALAETIRRSIAEYHHVEDAVEAGYRPFPAHPPPELKVIHYVHPERSKDEAERPDPSRPGSLLYERTDGGGLRLLGAMITAPVEAPLDELDARVPLSATRWHLHTNVCVPKPLWDERAWARTFGDGRPVFGPDSPVATEAGCDDVGGRFLPTVFGWMAHINVFAEDPADVWNAMYGHEHDEGDRPEHGDGAHEGPHGGHGGGHGGHHRP